MQAEYTESLIKAKKYYSSIGHILCPALSNAPIYFNRRGFRHFLRKKKGIRPIEDQMRRFNLLRYVQQVVSSAKSIAKYTKGNKFKFCEISQEVNKGYFVKVVTIEGCNGNLCFFSIADFRKQK